MRCEAGHEGYNPLCVECDKLEKQMEQRAEAAQFCECWLCDNTGPMGNCIKCGKPPSPSRMEGGEDRKLTRKTIDRLKINQHQRPDSNEPIQN